MDKLRKCPCGETPTVLHLCENGQGRKWMEITPDCCGEWSTEFRTQYRHEGSDELMALAVEAWNGLPRKGMGES